MKRITLLTICIILIKINFAQVFDVCPKAPIYLFWFPDCNINEYVLVFEDNFNGNSLDVSKWNSVTGVPRDPNQINSKQWHTANNIEISNGTLKLIVKEETFTGTYWNDKIDPPANQTTTFDYTAAEIKSKYHFFFGKYEIRCRLPVGKGFWPAFWTFGGQVWNEIDFFEIYGDNIDRFTCNIQYDFDGDGGSEDCNWSFDNGPDFSQWHTFTCIYNFDNISWYIDNQLVRWVDRIRTVSDIPVSCGDDIESGTYTQVKAYPKEPMKIIAGIGVQSNNLPDQNTPFPSSYEIDYIRYYKRMPCDGAVNATEISELNLSNNIYNVVIGTTIILSGNITIQNGQQVELIAKDEIVLEPGFTAEAGSDFIARIDPSICIGYGKSGDTINENALNDSILNIEKSSVKKQEINPDKNCQIRIFPNPSNGNLSVELEQDLFHIYELYLIDQQGKIVYSLKEITKNNFEINLSGLAKGTYLLNILDTKNKNSYINKVIFE